VEFQAPTPRFEDASLSITADAASVTTGSSDRDKLIKDNPQKFTMEGDFTLRGVTKPVKAQLTVQISKTIRVRFDLNLQRTTGGVPIT
jgi:polyisoprenoid-binding protein YceI